MQSKKMVCQKWMRSNSASPRLSNLRVKRWTPTEHIGWRSTETVLKCSANGGEKGGLVKIEIEGSDNLVQYNGEPLPYMKSLEPNEAVSFKNAYRAVKESNAADEIKVKATFVENETGWPQETTDEVTAVRVEVYPELGAPENECTFRRKLGVGETLNCRYYPSVTGLRWTGGSGTWLGTGPSRSYVCALRAEKDMILLRGLGCVYSPAVRVVEPQGVLSSDVGCQTFGLLPGKAGGLVLVQRLHVLPLDVSFQGVRIEEVPDAGSLKSGYFADTYFMNEWSHGPRQGAGVWQTVVSRNEFLLDSAGFVCELPQLDDAGFVSSLGTNGWSAGELTWNVPCGWASQSAEDGEVPVGQFAESALQEMAIDASGNFSVRKHSNSASRSISGKITVNDKELE